jgi:hypothetical protein
MDWSCRCSAHDQHLCLRQTQRLGRVRHSSKRGIFLTHGQQYPDPLVTAARFDRCRRTLSLDARRFIQKTQRFRCWGAVSHPGASVDALSSPRGRRPDKTHRSGNAELSTIITRRNTRFARAINGPRQQALFDEPLERPQQTAPPQKPLTEIRWCRSFAGPPGRSLRRIAPLTGRQASGPGRPRTLVEHLTHKAVDLYWLFGEQRWKNPRGRTLF